MAARRAIALAACVLVAATACGAPTHDAWVQSTTPITTVPPTTTTTEAPTTTTTLPTLDAKGVLAATSSSVALIRTPTGQGSGVLVGDRYVVTNAHVVQPWGLVGVRFPGRDWQEVEVLGVDGWSDIAVLGPVEATGGLSLTDTPFIVPGDRVFLVGYPGEISNEAVPTITAGIVSRMRSVDKLGLKYIQTDAQIAGGQSGGALVDEHGKLVGISGSSYAGFSIALASSNVEKSRTRILGATATSYESMRFGPASRTGPAVVGRGETFARYFVPPADVDRELSITLDDPSVPLRIADMAGERTLLTNGVFDLAMIAELPAAQAAAARERLVIATPTADGTFTAHIRANSYTDVYIGPMPDYGERVVNFTSSLPLVLTKTGALHALRVGDTVEGSVNGFEYQRIYTLDLVADQRVTIGIDGLNEGLTVFVTAPATPLFDERHSAAIPSAPFEVAHAEFDFTPPSDGTYWVTVTNTYLSSFKLSVH